VRIAAFVTPAREKEAKQAGAAVVGGDELIAELKAKEKINFAVAVAEPAMMPKLAAIAKLLGTKGLMPSPKSGTVTEHIGVAIQEIQKGRIEFKNDDSGNIHAIIGKVQYDMDKLLENYEAFMKALQQAKPSSIKRNFIASASLNASMGPSIRLKL
jgi:large subunit ribosomal protein L1